MSRKASFGDSGGPGGGGGVEDKRGGMWVDGGKWGKVEGNGEKWGKFWNGGWNCDRNMVIVNSFRFRGVEVAC